VKDLAERLVAGALGLPSSATIDKATVEMAGTDQR
jgi:hypothetical protein